MTILSLFAVILILLTSLVPAPALAAPQTFVANLTGSQETPPVTTMAAGDATFTLSEDGTTLTFVINVTNLDNAVAAHIHLARAGVSGPVVLTLFNEARPGVFSGQLVMGTRTSLDLGGALLGMPLSALADEIRAGNAYVNVHTTQNLGGEIRGQLMPAP